MNMLDKEVSKEYTANKGVAMVSNLLGLVIFIIVLVAVAIPVTTAAIDAANLTGTTATVTGYIPLFLAILGLVVVAAMYG